MSEPFPKNNEQCSIAETFNGYVLVTRASADRTRIIGQINEKYGKPYVTQTPKSHPFAKFIHKSK